MDMSFNTTSPLSYQISSSGLVIPSGIGGDDQNVNMKAGNEGDEMFWGVGKSMIPYVFDCGEANDSIPWGCAIEDQDQNGLHDESSDEFRMYKFKVVICSKESSHDWTECPFAHRGERARRRNPTLYCGETCPDYKKGYCRKGMTCQFSHGLFETWLHPQKYRTQRCKDGIYCNRRVCFFAHSEEELRCTSDPRTPCNMRNTQHSASSLKTLYNSCNSPRRIKYACSNIAFVPPQTYGLGFQRESSPRSGAVPRMTMTTSSSYISCPSPSSASFSSGSLQGFKMDYSWDLGDVIAGSRNADFVHSNEFNFSVDRPLLQTHVGGDQRSFEIGGNCGFLGLDSGKELSSKIFYNRFLNDQLKQEYSFCAAADQPDLAWVKELVEEV